MHSRPVKALLAASALALLAAGCGVSTGTASDRVFGGATSSGQSGASWLNAAASQTAEISSRRVMLSSVARSTDGEVVLESQAEGAFDGAAGRGQMTLELSGSEAARLGPMGSAEVILDGDEVYLKSPLNDWLGVDTPWVALPSGYAGDLGTTADLGQSADDALDLLQRSGSEVTTVGTEEVRGVPTTHLTTSIDVGALLTEASPEAAAELRDRLAEWELDLGQALDELPPIETEIWVDDDDLIRRVQLTFAGRAGISSVQTVELYDFDQPIDIVVPDPSEVTELDPTDLFGN